MGAGLLRGLSTYLSTDASAQTQAAHSHRLPDLHLFPVTGWK